MATDERQSDMFGTTPSQGRLFDEPVPPPPPPIWTKEKIRVRMHELIAIVRDADTMPFNADEQRSHTAMFPYMAEWLAKDEGEQLLLEFRTEMERLAKAA